MSDPVITAARASAVRIDLIVKRSTLLLVLLGIWWLLSLRYPHYVLPGPMRVWNALSLIVDNGDLWRNLAVTLKRVCIGFTLAAIISVPLGIMLGAIRPLGEFFEPVLPVLNTVSSAIWAIFGIIWFSISEASIIFVVFMTAMPLIITNVWQGTRAVNADFIELAHTLRHLRRDGVEQHRRRVTCFRIRPHGVCEVLWVELAHAPRHLRRDGVEQRRRRVVSLRVRIRRGGEPLRCELVWGERVHAPHHLHRDGVEQRRRRAVGLRVRIRRVCEPLRVELKDALRCLHRDFIP